MKSKAEDSMALQVSARKLEYWSADGKDSEVHDIGELGDLENVLRISWSL